MTPARRLDKRDENDQGQDQDQDHHDYNNIHRNIIEWQIACEIAPRPSVAHSVGHLLEFPYRQQQQDDLVASRSQSPTEHETPQQTPLESHQQNLIKIPPQSQTEEPPRDLFIDLSLSQSYDRSGVQKFDGGKSREMDKENRSGTCTKTMVQDHHDKIKRIWDEVQQEPQPAWLRELHTRLFTSPLKRPSSSPGKSSWSNLPPLCIEDTPTCLFFPHQKKQSQPSAQEWAWNLFHGCNRLSKQALEAGQQSMLCRLLDPDVPWESYMETQNNNFWELSHVLTTADHLSESPPAEQTLGGIVYHSIVDVSTPQHKSGGGLLAGDLLCALEIIKDQLSFAAATFGFYDQSQYTASADHQHNTYHRSSLQRTIRSRGIPDYLRFVADL
ncbi:hypothetical protein IFR05_011701 [Cadophora sp. M221]|nr:hypothetical protein IFR05_011701 [Cadophora sp. M221]